MVAMLSNGLRTTWMMRIGTSTVCRKRVRRSADPASRSDEAPAFLSPINRSLRYRPCHWPGTA